MSSFVRGNNEIFIMHDNTMTKIGEMNVTSIENNTANFISRLLVLVILRMTLAQLIIYKIYSSAST